MHATPSCDPRSLALYWACLCCPSQLVTSLVSNNLESTVASLLFGLRAILPLLYWILECVNAFDTKVLFPTKKTKTSSVGRNSSSKPLKSRSGYVDIAKYYPSLTSSDLRSSDEFVSDTDCPIIVVVYRAGTIPCLALTMTQHPLEQSWTQLLRKDARGGGEQRRRSWWSRKDAPTPSAAHREPPSQPKAAPIRLDPTE
jgi:hypothetical protein